MTCCRLANNLDLSSISLRANQKVSLSVGVRIRAPVQRMVSWAKPSPHPKQYLDRFDRFCASTRSPVSQHTDACTHVEITLRATCVEKGRMYVWHACDHVAPKLVSAYCVVCNCDCFVLWDEWMRRRIQNCSAQKFNSLDESSSYSRP